MFRRSGTAIREIWITFPVKGTFPTPYGIVRVSHTRKEDGSVQTEYTAPEGVEIIL